MQVLAASVLDAVERFLHAGYISAQPGIPVDRDILSPDYYPAGSVPSLQLDVAESLRLKGEQLAAAVVNGDTTAALAAGTSDPRWGAVLLGALCAAGAVAAYQLYAPKNPPAIRLGNRARQWALASGVAITLALGVACGDYAGGEYQDPVTQAPAQTQVPPVDTAASAETPAAEDPGATAAPAEPTVPAEPTPVATEPDPPWVGVEPREYEHPEQATQVILHGLIGNAARHYRSISKLANLAPGVALPTSSLTEGEAYALKTYAFDGWGNEFRLVEASNTCTVTSAGADGVFDTEDDLELSVRVGQSIPAEQGAMVVPAAWYVVEPQQDPYVLFYHPAYPATTRVMNIEYINHVPNETLANDLTGRGPFGLFTLEQLPTAASDIQARYDAMAATVAYKPLMLEVYDEQS
ncbi:MAG: hypothetical protein JW940_22575 [Polyangiaceae bacterium]|nr:hypothetical protein [Polyangiaceae bacterium]